MSEPTITIDDIVLPAGTITGHAGAVNADGYDPDLHPDLTAWEGVRVTFTPTVPLVVLTTPDGPVLLEPRTETGRFIDGRLLLDLDPPEGEPRQPLRLWASTDQTMVPPTWGWRATITGNNLPSAVAKMKPAPFVLEPGAVVDVAAILSGSLPDVPANSYESLIEAAADLRDAMDAASNSIIRTQPYALELLQTRLETGSGDMVIALAGDSTMNDSNDGPRVWLSDLGAQYPDLRIEYGGFNAATQEMQSPLAVLQEGASTGGDGVVVEDTFARTGDVVGSAADTGQVWASAPGSTWTIDGTKAVCTGTGGAVVDAGSKDVTVTADVTIDTTPGAGSKTFALYGAYLAGSTHVWMQVAISTTGFVTAHVYKRISGTIGTLATFGNLGLAPNAPNALTMSLSIDGDTVTGTINGITATGTLAAGDRDILGTQAGFGALAASTAGTTLDNFTVEAAVGPPIPAQTLRLYNGAVAGTKLDYAAARIPIMFPERPDVVWFQSGHNYGSDTPAAYIAAVKAFLTAFDAVHSPVPRIAASQNPQRPPRTNAQAADHAARQVALRVEAAKEGWDYIPVLEAYLSDPDWGNLLQADGLHPTVGPGVTGAQKWADTATAELESRRRITA